jgi:hypothetical protein
MALPGVQTLTTLSATDSIIVDNGGAVITKVAYSVLALQVQSQAQSFTTSAQSNSTSITLSVAFTALTYTQTSTGNTVHLTATPYNGQRQGFSMTNIVTNLTVSSAANTVTGGAIGTTVAGASYFWTYDTASTTWYRS